MPTSVRYLLAILMLSLVACGGTLPPPQRRVIENDLGAWRFRRYQHVVDVEVWVEGNPAVAHTASYVRDEAEKSGRITDQDVVNAFVTEYKREAGVTAALVRFARRVALESGYVVEEREIEGVRVVAIRGHGETWTFWPSGRFVVKVGGRGLAEVPGRLIEAYAERYPSRLREGALDAPLDEEKN